jgi:ABC-type oligopeptide transport system ATPase subunit
MISEHRMIEFKDVSKSYSSGSLLFSQKKQVLSGVTLDLRKQETLAIVGESGCGKTTLAKCLLRIEKDYTGEIFLDVGGQMTEIRQLKQKDLAREVQMVFQDPHSSLNPRKKIFDIIIEPLLVFGERNDLQQKAESILHDVGLSKDFLNKYPHMMSGGQKQRVALARALIYRPQVLVCDEPVSALDVSIQAQVLNLLKDLQAKYRLSIIFISHDLSVVRFIAQRIAVFSQGVCVEKGTTAEIFS